jgi:hypothetical protein
MEKEIKEERIIVLKRVPPGDRWNFTPEVLPPGNKNTIFPSLTDALEGYYQLTGLTNFYIEARSGTVEIIIEEEVEVPVKRFSLYGED